MSEIKIEKGIPIPYGYEFGRLSKYPFDKMEVGDSILIKNRMSYGNLKPKKFVTRKVEGGILVWRVK